MKSAALALVLALALVTCVSAQTVYRASEHTVLWIAPTVDLAMDEELWFEVALARGTTLTVLGRTQLTEYTIPAVDTLPWAVAIRAIVVGVGETTSDWAYSVVVADVDPAFGTFAIALPLIVTKPTDMRRQ